jgi:hypothetical protein
MSTTLIPDVTHPQHPRESEARIPGLLASEEAEKVWSRVLVSPGQESQWASRELQVVNRWLDIGEIIRPMQADVLV